jgi:hypothetical protein
MRPKFIILIVALSLLIPPTTRAQTSTTPAEAFDAKRLVLGTDSMLIFLEHPGGRQPLGTLWDELTAVDGGTRLRRVYRTTNTLFGNHLDTVTSALPRLTPVRHRTQAARIRQNLEFRADSVVGWSEMEGRPRRTIARPSIPGAFDAATFDLLVRSAPLTEKYAVEVRGVLAEPDTVTTLRARVAGSDSVRTEGGQYLPAWVIEMDFAGLPSTMWIEKASRRLLRQTIRLSPEATILMERHR